MQSKKDDSFTINISDLKLDDFVDVNDVTIKLDDTYGTTTTYWAGDSVTDMVLDNNSATDTIDISWIYNNMNIDPNQVEKMCELYPGLDKVWRNFKSVYDMCKQDYEGKKKAGEINDDYPF